MAKRVSKVQQRFALLVEQLRRVPQSSIKGLSHSFDDSVCEDGQIGVYISYKGLEFVVFYIRTSGKRILCIESHSYIEPKHFEGAAKVFRHAAKFVRLANEYK